MIKLLRISSLLALLTLTGTLWFLLFEDMSFIDALYMTVITLTTVGFGDITPMSEAGRWVTVLMILSGIILIPWQVSRIAKEWIYIASKKESLCPGCGLRYHDEDASHCKSCGHVIYQEYDGD